MSPEARHEPIKAYVLSAGLTGVTIRDVVAHFGIGIGTAGDALRALRRRGEIEPSHPKGGGQANRWGAIGIAARQDAISAAMAERKAARQAARGVIVAMPDRRWPSVWAFAQEHAS